MARCLKTLSDPNRIRILRILVRGEFCVSDLVAQLQVDQPKVSHHLAILRSAGIIRCRRDGRHINYSLWPAVHQPKPGAAGQMDEFNLGEISVAFNFATEAEAAAGQASAPGASGPSSAPSAPATVRVRVGEMQGATGSSAAAPASGSASGSTSS